MALYVGQYPTKLELMALYVGHHPTKLELMALYVGQYLTKQEYVGQYPTKLRIDGTLCRTVSQKTRIYRTISHKI